MPVNPQALGIPAPGTLPAMGQPLGGLNLGAIAQGAQAETGQRIAGQSDLISAYLSQVLGEQTAGNQAMTERDLRMQEFARQQELMRQALDQQLSGIRGQTEDSRMQWDAEQAALQRGFLADEANRQRAFEFGQGAAGPEQLGFAEMERIRTDEAIRQARTLASLETDDGAPRLSDFGSDTINPYRGQALQSHGGSVSQRASNAVRGALGKPRRSTGPTSSDMKKAQELVDKYGADPNRLISEARKYFKNRDEAASIALWQLGYGV